MELMGTLGDGRMLYLTELAHGCLSDLPWADGECDCFVLNCSANMKLEDVECVAKETTQARTDWVQTAGVNAELLHDAIDAMSVRMGRQSLAGDGSPMTSWHAEALTTDEMANLVVHAAIGSHDHIVAVFIGDKHAYASLKEALRRSLGQRFAAQ